MTVRQLVQREIELSTGMKELEAWLKARKEGLTSTEISVSAKYSQKGKLETFRLNQDLLESKDFIKAVEHEIEIVIQNRKKEIRAIKEKLESIDKQVGDISV